MSGQFLDCLDIFWIIHTVSGLSSESFWIVGKVFGLSRECLDFPDDFCESCDSGESDDFGRFGETSDFGEFDDSGEFGDFGESGDSGEFGESGDSGDFGDLVNLVILVNMVKIW